MNQKPLNPFSTSATRAGVLPFEFDSDEDWKSVFEKLSTQKWLGQVIGPHGSGKSTFLLEMARVLIRLGCRVEYVRYYSNESGSKRRENLTPEMLGVGKNSELVPEDFSSELNVPKAILVTDGFEQIGWIGRNWRRIRCFMSGNGLIVTAHTQQGLPLLVETRNALEILTKLVKKLLVGYPADRIVEVDIEAAFQQADNNVREALFVLYDLWEVRAREHA